MPSTSTIFSALALPFVSIYTATKTIAYYTDKGGRIGVVIGAMGALTYANTTEITAHAILRPFLPISDTNASQGGVVLGACAGGLLGIAAGTTYGTYQAFFGRTQQADAQPNGEEPVQLRKRVSRLEGWVEPRSFNR